MPDVSRNRHAFYDYEILERYEAGIELFGFEVKSVKLGRMTLAGAVVLIRGNEAWLTNATIPSYQLANTPPGYDPARPRRLLLHRSEIKELVGRASARGLTLIPLRVYTKKSKVKVELGLARRKRKYDKRARIREREDQRKIERAFREETRG